MRRDDQVKAALAFKKYACISTGWQVQSPEGKDPKWEVTEFVRWVLKNMDPNEIGGPTLDTDLYAILSALDYGFCLAGPTPIPTPSGSKPIESLVGTTPWVYSLDANRRLRLARATRVWKTGTRQAIKVRYEWGPGGKGKRGDIVCTPSHPFMLLDGTYRKAGDLRVGDRLMPFYRIEAKGTVTHPRVGLGWGGFIPEHRFVWEEVYGPIKDGDHIHHRDHDKRNNEPTNLTSLSGREHLSYHSREWWRRADDDAKAQRAEKQSEARRGRSFPGSIEGTKRAWADPEKRAERGAAIAAAQRENPPWKNVRHHTDETRDAMSASAKADGRAARFAPKPDARQRDLFSENHRVIAIEEVGAVDVYDMEVPQHHNFAANGVFVHNSLTEKIWAPIESGPWAGHVALRALKTRAPHYISFAQDEYGNLQDNGVIQMTNGVGPGGGMPRDKFILYSYQGQFDNPYGVSDLEAAYTPWWIKYNSQKWLAMLLERLGIPPIFGLYNPMAYQAATVGAGGGTLVDELKKIMANLQAATFGVIPRPNKESLEFWAPQLADNATRVFLPSLDYMNKGIARSILMPDLLGMTQDSSQGSYARAEVHFDVFLLVVETIRRDIASVLIQHQVIEPLCLLNFPGLDVFPQWSFLPLTDNLRLELLKAWNDLVANGVVSQQDDDEKHIRKLTQFPDLKPGAKPPREPAPPKPPGGTTAEPGTTNGRPAVRARTPARNGRTATLADEPVDVEDRVRPVFGFQADRRYDWSDQPRVPAGSGDPSGEWTRWGGGGGDLATRLREPGGGFTYDPATGLSPTTGYVVSAYPEHSKAIRGAAAMPADELAGHVTDYVVEKWDVIAQPGYQFGGWHDPDDGTVYLDVVQVAATEAEATAIALAHDQKAYYDIGKGVSVVVNPHAKSGQP